MNQIVKIRFSKIPKVPRNLLNIDTILPWWLFSAKYLSKLDKGMKKAVKMGQIQIPSELQIHFVSSEPEILLFWLFKPEGA